jgi:hypothetical protein
MGKPLKFLHQPVLPQQIISFRSTAFRHSDGRCLQPTCSAGCSIGGVKDDIPCRKRSTGSPDSQDRWSSTTRWSSPSSICNLTGSQQVNCIGPTSWWAHGHADDALLFALTLNVDTSSSGQGYVRSFVFWDREPGMQTKTKVMQGTSDFHEEIAHPFGQETTTSLRMRQRLLLLLTCSMATRRRARA